VGLAPVKPGPIAASDPAVAGEITRDTLQTQLSAASRGDESAFAAVYDSAAPRVYGLVHRILRDVHQSEEVTQEVFLQVWETSQRFDPTRGSALSWIMTLAHRRAVDRVRSSEAQRRRDLRDAERSFRAPFDQTAEGADASMEATRVREALAELSTTQRRALELAYFAGHTHAEVSQLLQIPLGTAKTRIRDGLIRLRDSLDLVTFPRIEPAAHGDST
jgi:RNA polymerase sigma-70 factor (ECF subfamily)